METLGHPSQHSSSPFIWFYLRPLVPALTIGLHNPLLFLQLQPQTEEKEAFLADGLFSKGTISFSPTLPSCPQLALGLLSPTPSALWSPLPLHRVNVSKYIYCTRLSFVGQGG